jgi:hypothetical protein
MLENYKILENGIITQINREPFNYGLDYSANYNKLGELGKRMAHLRLGYLLGVLGYTPKTLLDVGYGNADFLSVASTFIEKCYGSDVTSDYPLPENVQYLSPEKIYDEKFDVVCFFDVLEHFDDIYDIRKLQSDIVYVSLPNCNYKSDEWFDSWKHRKPNEHLWFFNEDSLKTFFEEIGFKCIATSNVEDIIRKDINNTPNILTGVFTRIK